MVDKNPRKIRLPQRPKWLVADKGASKGPCTPEPFLSRRWGPELGEEFFRRHQGESPLPIAGLGAQQPESRRELTLAARS